jgi:excisionase family DNA binding protein
LGISRNTLQAEIRDGRLSACRVRGRWYVTRAQLAAWLKRIEVSARES